MAYSLDSNSGIGAVSLTVTDLQRSVAYYERLGFALNRQEQEVAWLGSGGVDLLALYGNQDAQRVRRTTGLYHFAILLPSRLDLARAFKNMIDAQIPVGGYSDHLVSEAIYLSDPDGIGIEVYADRPRDVWRYDAMGELRIGTVSLDLESLMSELATDTVGWHGFPAGTTIGHIHLHVADLETAGQFYSKTLGFDFVTKYGRSAQFLSVGGYHHHIGMNTWAGVGISKAPEGSIGLKEYSVVVPNEAAKVALLENLAVHEIGYDLDEGDPIVTDPSGNKIRIASKTVLINA